MARQPILETAIMDVLWDDGDWVPPTEVRKRLAREVAPTTVGTVLSRLHDKGWVERRKHGKGYRYRAVDTREQHVASRMEAALEASQDRPLALLEFVDRLPPADRSRLRRILGL
jgi:predicted transcriptional regulator